MELTLNALKEAKTDLECLRNSNTLVVQQPDYLALSLEINCKTKRAEQIIDGLISLLEGKTALVTTS